MKFSKINLLRRYVQEAATRSFVPHSGQPRAALALLSNGDWTCGVRIENACYPLVIPAFSSVLVCAASVGRRDIKAIVFSDSVTQSEKRLAQQIVPTLLDQFDEDIIGQTGCNFQIRNPLETCKHLPLDMNSNEGIRLARHAAEFAHTPESDFPVGAIVVTGDHKYFQGVNIEYDDWTQILCAERAALAAAMSAGTTNITDVYVSCPKSAVATPCGACRQVLHEVAPNAIIWMDRGAKEHEHFRTDALLPQAFRLPL